MKEGPGRTKSPLARKDSSWILLVSRHLAQYEKPSTFSRVIAREASRFSSVLPSHPNDHASPPLSSPLPRKLGDGGHSARRRNLDSGAPFQPPHPRRLAAIVPEAQRRPPRQRRALPQGGGRPRPPGDRHDGAVPRRPEILRRRGDGRVPERVRRPCGQERPLRAGRALPVQGRGGRQPRLRHLLGGRLQDQPPVAVAPVSVREGEAVERAALVPEASEAGI
ncbi:hypothetical protein LZ32DRAFT_460511 [Colletotrichum eremochloae]|nr:hypothetical protein LZ32DRAFT_460511 [Colletotrichum eremochloae]